MNNERRIRPSSHALWLLNMPDESKKKKNALTPVERLQELSLVKKVGEEMNRQLQMSDATLAEFFVHCAETQIKTMIKTQTDTLSAAKALKTDLQQKGADNVSLSFCSLLIELVEEQSPRMQRLRDKRQKKAAKKEADLPHVLSSMESSERKAELGGVFPGLAKPNLNHAVSLDRDFYEHGKDEPGKPKPEKRQSRDKERHLESNTGRDRPDSRRDKRSHGVSSSTDNADSSRRRGVSNLPAWMTKEEDDQPKKRSRADKLELYGIYQGTVKKLLDFGMVVDFFADGKPEEGMVYNAHVAKQRVEHPSKVFRKGQSVWVKVISLRGGKVVLSAKDVDQSSGKDLMPHRSLAASETGPPGPRSGSSMDKKYPSSSVVHPGLDVAALKRREAEEEASRMVNAGGSYYGPASSAPQERTVRRRKQLTEQELFEAQQLIRSGVLPVEQYPTFDAEGGMGLLDVEETEEETEVELAEVEPAFLRGQTKRSGRDLEPVKIVKNPDGSMGRAAMQQVALSKERRELRQAQANQLIDSIPKDLNRPWEDPLPEAGERHFAQELRSINMSAFDGAPEWKKKAENKTLSYGIISNKSIKEQRESLPIYRLKSELVEAISKNQILVVVGETGSGKYHGCDSLSFCCDRISPNFAYKQERRRK